MASQRINKAGSVLIPYLLIFRCLLWVRVQLSCESHPEFSARQFSPQFLDGRSPERANMYERTKDGYQEWASGKSGSLILGYLYQHAHLMGNAGWEKSV